MAEITYEVLEKLGILSESQTGWTKELRLVNWNNRGPRYDLREWSPGDRKASRGITLSLEEIRVLQEILVETEFPELQEEEGFLEEAAFAEGEDATYSSAVAGAKKKAG